jgi:hypothetical protein
VGLEGRRDYKYIELEQEGGGRRLGGEEEKNDRKLCAMKLKE